MKDDPSKATFSSGESINAQLALGISALRLLEGMRIDYFIWMAKTRHIGSTNNTDGNNKSSLKTSVIMKS